MVCDISMFFFIVGFRGISRISRTMAYKESVVISKPIWSKRTMFGVPEYSNMIGNVRKPSLNTPDTLESSGVAWYPSTFPRKAARLMVLEILQNPPKSTIKKKHAYITSYFSPGMHGRRLKNRNFGANFDGFSVIEWIFFVFRMFGYWNEVYVAFLIYFDAFYVPESPKLTPKIWQFNFFKRLHCGLQSNSWLCSSPWKLP